MIRIKPNDRDEIRDAYAVYWFDNVRHYFYIPYDGYGGFSALRENECDLIECNMCNYTIVRNGAGRDMILHITTVENDLLDDLIEHDPEAMQEFLRRLEKFKNS